MMPITPEILIPRLGDVLVEQGKITVDQLQQALEYQKQQRLQGASPLIGQVLVDLGLLDQDTLNGSITQQILMLQTGLREANNNLERKVQERTHELELAYRKLSELTQLKANFISNISHELRTPLTHINGYVELLLSDKNTTLSADQKQSVEVIKRASLRLEHLIDDLILFSTSETGKLAIAKDTIDVQNIIDVVISHNQEAAVKKHIQLSSEVAIRQKILLADHNKLKWVLNQLVDNAIKFTNPGGKVTLQLEELPDHFTFRVKDSGIGIATDKREEIFEEFHQLDGSSTRSQGGTGLGLALVRNILKAHGASIQVDSVPGQGSCFEFQLMKTQSVD